MKIPDKIIIAGREIKIEWGNKELPKRNNDGEADYRSQIIHLFNGANVYDQCRENLEIVFIHEIVHFIDHVTSGNMTEEQIERFSEILYQVIKQLQGGDHE